MAAASLTVNALFEEEILYNVKFGHTLDRINNTSIMSRVDI